MCDRGQPPFAVAERDEAEGEQIAAGEHAAADATHQGAEVGMRMTEDGCVIVHASLHDHGCGTVTAFQMIVAEALGIGIDEDTAIRVDLPETTVPAGFSVVSNETVRYSAEIDGQQQIADLLAMTPHLFRASSEGKARVAALQALAVTVDVRVTRYRRN